jgi:signal transduction histidine kinase
VTFKLETGLDGLSVWGDAEQLQQVLVNILTNALAATNEGGEIGISVAQREATMAELERLVEGADPSHGMMVTLTVRDTGCGMPEEHLGRAFEPFFTTKAIGTGTGLGLFLSRQIVASHGGSLSIDSLVGKGTTVTIALPRCTAQEPVNVVEGTDGV